MDKKKKRIILIAVVILLVAGALFGAYQMFRFPAMFRSLEDKSLDEASVNKLIDELNGKDELKVLVAYFSYSGTTKAVAEQIKSYTGADIFEITMKEEYGNVYLGSHADIRKGSKPEMGSVIENISEYDVVFVGFPLWWHATPAVINTFLETYDLKGGLIIPFCTSTENDISEAMPTFLDSCDGLAVYGEKRFAAGESPNEWLNGMSLDLSKIQ